MHRVRRIVNEATSVLLRTTTRRRLRNGFHVGRNVIIELFLLLIGVGLRKVHREVMEPLHDTLGHGFVSKALALVVVLALGILGVTPATGAPQPGKFYKIGVLHPGSGSEERRCSSGGRVRRGPKPRRRIRHAEGRVGRLPALARARRPRRDVILATSNSAVQAAKNATKSIPIVMAFSDDPVALGFVPGLARPGGNITGVTLAAGGSLAAKRLELLKTAVPRVRRIALLDWPRAAATTSMPQVQEAQPAARSLTLETTS